MKKDYTKTWLNILLLIAVMNIFIGYQIGLTKVPEPRTPLIIGDSNESALVIEVVYWLQKEVGAKQDAIVGIETMTLVNAQSKIDEPEYFNKLAAKYFTPSGGKED